GYLRRRRDRAHRPVDGGGRRVRASARARRARRDRRRQRTRYVQGGESADDVSGPTARLREPTGGAGPSGARPAQALDRGADDGGNRQRDDRGRSDSRARSPREGWYLAPAAP